MKNSYSVVFKEQVSFCLQSQQHQLELTYQSLILLRLFLSLHIDFLWKNTFLLIC